MTLGSVQPGAEVWTVGKDATNAIAIGSVCVRDTATTPDSYKLAPAAAAVAGPFVVCVNKAAAATDTAFSAAFSGLVTVTADGVIEPGGEVQAASATAGQVIAYVATDITASPTETTIEAGLVSRIVGRYMGHENELTGKTPATAAADGDLVVIKLGASG